MKRNFLLIGLFMVGVIMILQGITSDVYTASGGAIAGRTGSPGDGADCTSCHSGTPSTQSGWITSDIPGTGYVPGTTYTISATANGTGATKFGFQVCAETSSGTKTGTLIVTNTTTTQLTGSSKYITHKSAGTSGTDTKTWTFNWTAPAAGTGTVTFFGAFNVANNNGNTAGDQIVKSNLAVTEATSTSVSYLHQAGNDVLAWPNPASDELTISYNQQTLTEVSIAIYDLLGKKHDMLLPVYKSAGIHSVGFSVQGYTPGVYLMVITQGEKKTLKKIVIGHE